MAALHANLADWLSAHHGIVSSSNVRTLGITPDALRALLDSGELIPVHEGVYRHRIWPTTQLSRDAAACAADPSIVIGCGGGARLWRFRGCGHVPDHALTSRVTKPIVAGLDVHRCTILPADHIHCRPDGIRVTSPVRTVFDLARHLNWLQLESVIEQGIDRRMFDVPALQRMAGLMCHRGRAGSALFREIVDSRPVWRRPVDSHPELAVRRAMLRAGVDLETQVPVRLPSGLVIHPDLADVAARFYVEIDDHFWHGGRVASRRDADRDRQVRLAGGRIERVSTDELDDLPRLVEQLRAALEQQRRAVRSNFGGETVLSTG